MDEILAGRWILGTLIAIFRLTAGAAADLDAFAALFLLLVVAVAGADFLVPGVFAEICFLLTFLLAVLVAVFLAGFPLAAVLATFFLEAVF